MKTISRFKKQFSISNLENIYYKNIILSRTTGIDKLTHENFSKNLSNSLGLISKKIDNETYKFSKYRLKLISKGRGKPPREISIPTIRDRVTLRGMYTFLTEIYGDSIFSPLPQSIIREVKSSINSGKYNYHLKIDIKNYYPSIRHDKLITRLGRRIRTPWIKSVILDALTSPSVTRSLPTDKKNHCGIPQGLSISNILASIYLSNFDKKYGQLGGIKYFRYVDDILILCKSEDCINILKNLKSDMARLGLEIHDPLAPGEKSSSGTLLGDFSYLGYLYSCGNVTVRDESTAKLKESIISIFTSYRHASSKSIEFLAWRLNLRITGCTFQDKCRGWMFFYSEITDKTLLHELDILVDKLVEKYALEFVRKRFVRSYFEIRYRRHESNYIPNFDKYTDVEKRNVLKDYFYTSARKKFWVDKLSEIQVDQLFRSKIDKQVKDLQVDFLGFGYS